VGRLQSNFASVTAEAWSPVAARSRRVPCRDVADYAVGFLDLIEKGDRHRGHVNLGY